MLELRRSNMAESEALATIVWHLRPAHRGRDCGKADPSAYWPYVRSGPTEKVEACCCMQRDLAADCADRPIRS